MACVTGKLKNKLTAFLVGKAENQYKDVGLTLKPVLDKVLQKVEKIEHELLLNPINV